MRTQFSIFRSFFILLTLSIMCGNIFPQQGWNNLNLSFGGPGIYFKDVNNGLISNQKTTNAGSSWSVMSFGGYKSFPDPNTGYATGGGFLYKTTNFGDNWVSQSNPSLQILNSINFPNVNTGFACGESGKVIKTTNGGSNWLLHNIPLSANFNLQNVCFVNSETGYISGYTYFLDTSVFMKTTNGGNNWLPQFYPPSWGAFISMFFVNANTGFVASVSPSYIYKTTNSGINWVAITVPTSNRIYSLHFPSAMIGYGACHGGQILKTTNGGNNWFLQTTGTGSVLYSIFFINDLTGYCSGNNNTVLKTTDGGGPPIGIIPISNEVPMDFRLEQNYPNPFNPTTNIEFSIPKSSFVKLVVFDMLGRELETLVSENLAAGTFKADWNASDYPSGIYFYRLEANGFVELRKMILVK